MKIKGIVWLVFWACTYSIKAQEKLTAGFNLKNRSTQEIDFNETNAQISVYKKIDDKNEIINTTEYTNLKIKYETGTYDYFVNLNQFNRMQNKLEISHKVSDATKLNLAIIPIINFQQNFGISDLSVLGSFRLNQQLSSKIALNIGVERSTVFGSPKFIPISSLQLQKCK